MTLRFHIRKSRRLTAFALPLTLLMLTSLAQAQYVWIDERGLKHYSDRPPAPAVPQKRILKAPGPAASAGDAASATPMPAAAPTLAERDADFRKRREEEADQEQKSAAAAQRRSELAIRCEALRGNQLLLESGRRIGISDQAGAPGYMDDGERARQLQATRRALAGNCH